MVFEPEKSSQILVVVMAQTMPELLRALGTCMELASFNRHP